MYFWYHLGHNAYLVSLTLDVYHWALGPSIRWDSSTLWISSITFTFTPSDITWVTMYILYHLHSICITGHWGQVSDEAQVHCEYIRYILNHFQPIRYPLHTIRYHFHMFTCIYLISLSPYKIAPAHHSDITWVTVHILYHLHSMYMIMKWFLQKFQMFAM